MTGGCVEQNRAYFLVWRFAGATESRTKRHFQTLRVTEQQVNSYKEESWSKRDRELLAIFEGNLT
ncbi:MAG: hypothetical protein CMJ80_15425 [Planctomycetaceae bacterium]|nr:hypothetical protein [Planctomycetaceae bacterium]